MRLYYTGAQAFRAAQARPAQALGGYPSSSLVANDALEAVFAGASPYARQQGTAQVRCLALLNETPGPVQQLRVTLEDHPELALLLAGSPAGPALELHVGLALPNTDQDANPYFEAVPDGTASPYHAAFGTDVLLAQLLQPGQYCAVWLRLRPRTPAPGAALPAAQGAAPMPLPPYIPHLLRFTWS